MQRGYRAAARAPLAAPAGFNCSGWASSATHPSSAAEPFSVFDATVATCFYNGGHTAPSSAWDLVWLFFGLPAPPSPPEPGKDSCARIGCGGHSETCWCNGECSAHGDCCADYREACGGGSGGCTAARCGGKYSCDEWIAWDSRYTCPSWNATMTAIARAASADRRYHRAPDMRPECV